MTTVEVCLCILLGKATGLVGMYQVGKHRKSRNQKKRG